VKRREAAALLSVGLTKLDRLIGAGLIEARKEPGEAQSRVWVSVPSCNKYVRSLGIAPGARLDEEEAPAHAHA
jgi:hypothetical protein